MAELQKLFTGKALSVIRVLLVRYPKTWNIRELAQESGVSVGRTWAVSKALIKERIAIRTTQRGELKIMVPLDLLKKWATINNFAANTKFLGYYSEEQEIEKFCNKFKGKKKPEYAFAALTGALFVAPYVRPTNVHVYVKNEEDAKTWAEHLKLRPMERGGEINFAITNDLGVFYGAHEVDGVWVVSDVQLYVDLLNYAGRGEEAAQALLKVIEKRWKNQSTSKEI